MSLNYFYLGQFPPMLIPLQMLSAGELALVGCVLGGADQICRLKELGIREGVEIEMIQPGSTSIIRLAGHKLCFRADDMARILVQVGVAA